MDASQPDERREPKRRHEGDGPIGDPPEQGIARAQVPDEEPGEQRADTGAQRNFHAFDRKAYEHADNAAEENRKSQHDEIGRRVRGNDDADGRGRVLYDGLRADDPKQVAALQHDPGRDRDLLATAAHRSQVQATGPIFPRYIRETLARKLRTDEQDVGRQEWNVEEFFVLDLLGARSNPLDNDLSRAGERDHVARLERHAGIDLEDASFSAKPVDEQPVLGHACLGRGDGQSGQRGSFRQSIGAQLELPPAGGQAWFPRRTKLGLKAVKEVAKGRQRGFT